MAQLSKNNNYLYLDPHKRGENGELLEPASPWDCEIKILQEWSDLTGNSKQLIKDRINRGWSIRDAILTKSRPYRGKGKDASVARH